MRLSSHQIYELLVHRKDVYAEQQKSGIYIPIKKNITIKDIEEHLQGLRTLGVYCLAQDNTIKWCCIDLDGERLDEIDKISKDIYDNVTGFWKMREFSGRRGYHVWFFFNKPILAELGKRMILARINLLDIDISRFEFFPKQTTLNETRKYGNLVKLPCGLHKVSNKYSEVLDIDLGVR